MSSVAIHVTGLAVTAVKGMRIEQRDEVMVELSGVAENRRFYLVDDRGRMVNSKQLGELTSVRARYSDSSLELSFPDGRRVAGRVDLGERIAVRFYSQEVTAPTVGGPFSEALSAHVGHAVRLVQADSVQDGVDRGQDGAVSLISRASLHRLAQVAGADQVDSRRFRMLIEIDGVDPHAEDEWIGRRLRIGAALVAFAGHVGRCLITSRDPDSGEIDLPTLDLLRSYRDSAHTTEPLAFGIYGRVLEPGLVRVGDPVAVAD